MKSSGIVSTPTPTRVGISSNAATPRSGSTSGEDRSVQYRLVRLLRAVENRLCADCSVPLLMGAASSLGGNDRDTFQSPAVESSPQQSFGSTIVASLKYRVWLCMDCAYAHHTALSIPFFEDITPLPLPPANAATPAVLPPPPPTKDEVGHLNTMNYLKRRNDSTWCEEEVVAMEQAVSNLRVNRSMERYLTRDWPKINKNSTLQDRALWVKAKYHSRYFSIPQKQVLDARLSDRMHSKKTQFRQATTLPMRAVDYFVTLTAGPLQVMVPGRGKKNQPPRPAPQSLDDLKFTVQISDQFPSPQYYGYPKNSGDGVPHLITSVVFPNGLRLVTEEKRPFCFSFVVTNEKQVKMYGTALIVYEVMEYSSVQQLLTDSSTVPNSLRQSLQNKVLYAPKAMVVLSHYPFYNLCSLFLTQLYRVSLSESPLPIERYIANFMLELPLPPQGRVEVQYSLPCSLIHLSRPPRNRLPMIDFSYRPLFTFLNIDSILTIFSCLCQELTVCILSSNLALLTPVQEALLSFLFPLVWQGCYVPVLPHSLLELLQAPVPLLVGVHCQQISEVVNLSELPHSASDVLYVHLDSGTLHFSPQCRPVALPKHDGGKLRKKLIECSEMICRDPGHMAWMNTAGHVYPNDEHLHPIKKFIHEQGVLSHSAGASSKKAVPGQHQTVIACTLEAGRNNVAELSSENIAVQNPLDPQYNTGPKLAIDAADFSDKLSTVSYTSATSLAASSVVGSGSKRKISFSSSSGTKSSNYGFNAQEIRDAFLRFFVASFSSYHEYFTSSGGSGNHKHRKQRLDESNENTSSEKNIAADVVEKESFLFDEFVLANDDPFIKQLICSQMFANFVTERVDAPNQPEIVFFDEQILAKRNRSKLALSKASTPFLSDTSEDIKRSFTVPGPLTANVPPGKKYHYEIFPILDTKELELVVEMRHLTGVDEDRANSGTRRFDSTSNVISNGNKQLHNPASALMMEFGPDQQRMQLGESVDEVKERLKRFLKTQTAEATCGSVNPVEQRQASLLEASSEANEVSQVSMDDEDVDNFFIAAHYRYLRVVDSITTAQSILRAKPYYRRFRRLHAATRTIRRAWQAAKLRREITQRQYFKYAAVIQHWARGFLYQRRFKRIHRGLIRAQSLVRQWNKRRRFQLLRSCICRIQSTIRGFLTRTAQLQFIQLHLRRRRHQLLLLWMAGHTPLLYRSLFWRTMNNASYIDLALHEEELRRLYRCFGFYRKADDSVAHDGSDGIQNQQILLHQSDAFEDQFERVENSFMVIRLQALHSDTSLSAEELEHKCLDCVTTVLIFQQQKLSMVNDMRTQLYDERRRFYQSMKYDRAVTQQSRDLIFSLFHISNEKKRKQKVSERVWTCADEHHSDLSAQAVFSVLLCHHNESSYSPTGGLVEHSLHNSSHLSRDFNRLSVISSGNRHGIESSDLMQQQRRFLGGNRPDLEGVPIEAIEWARGIRAARIISNCMDTVRGCIKAIQMEY